MSRPRRKPYTAIGIRRIPCFRCSKPSRYQWQICADGNRFRGLCGRCDVALNKLVLRFVGDADWRVKIDRYRKRAE